MEHNELKPCPFCGKHAYIGQRKRIAGDRFTALCSNSTCAASGATKYFYRRSEAVEAWNRRAENGKS